MVSAAFVPAVAVPRLSASRTAVSSRPAPRMSLRKHAARLATIPATLAAVAPAIASEGTGEGLGIDSALLFLPLILIPSIFLALYLQFDGSQNKDEFFGPYDQRRR